MHNNIQNIRGNTLYQIKTNLKKVQPSYFGNDSFSYSTNALRKHKMLTIPFTGLTKALSGKLYELSTEIVEKLKRNGIVGTLPEEWINTIPKESKTEDIKDIYEGFADAANALMLDCDTAIKYYYDYKDNPNELKPLLEDKLDRASNLLKETLVKHKIIDTNDPLKIEYLGIGLHGCGYKFEVAGKKYVIKSYHDYPKEELLTNNHHGPYIETNRATYINKHFLHSQYAKFYFSDLNNNYMIIQFIDKNTDKPKATINEQDHGFQYNDLGDKEKYNLINNYLIDYGSISIKSKILANNKTAQWVHNKVVDKKTSTGNHKEWDKLYKLALQNKVPNCHDILLGLVDTVRYLPEEHRETRALKFIESTNFDENFKLQLIDYIIPDEALFTFHIKANFELKEDQQFSAIEKLIMNSNKKVKTALINKIKTIDPSIRFALFKKLSIIHDKGLTILLQQQITHLSETEQRQATVLNQVK